MKQPKNKFRYVITNRLGVLQVAPLGESNFTIEWNRESEGKLDYKNELPSKIKFTGAAYNNLLKLEQSIYRCDFVNISVERHCANNTWVPWFSGRMSFNDGTWDLDRCEVEIKLDDIKEEQCFEDNKTRELNLLQNIYTRRSVYLNPTNINIETVSYTSPWASTGTGDCTQIYWGGGGDPGTEGWVVTGYEYIEDRELTTGPTDPGQCQTTTYWARETITQDCSLPSPGTEWVLVADSCPGGTRTYARPVRTYGCRYMYPDYQSPYQVTTYTCSIVGDSSTNVLIDNGLSLSDVINLFMSSFCPGFTFVSNFFQINPDVASTINYVTGLRSKTRFITLFQKSDVKRPTVSGNATKAMLSFEKLFESLVEMFNVRWRVEGGNVVRMEHVSYFTKTQGFDLTQPKWAKWVVGKRRYTYENGEIPQREEYKFMEAGYGDFQGAPIIYSGGCVSQGSRDAIKTHTVDKVTTDVELCLSNPDPDSKVVSDDGFVFVACDFDGTNYYIITESPILGGSSLNNSLGWAQLHRDYHKWDRPLSRGNMNYVDTTFYSTKPTKKGEKITIPLCCGDTFNPDNTIKTALGVGTVDKATFSFKDETLEVDLLYPADQGLTNNTAPVAVNDTVVTYMDVPITINVLGNDTDADPGATITRVEIVLQPTHGTAVLNPNQTISYVPATGYTGDDYFVYRIYDDWNQVSNNALVAITVRAANTAPVANNNSYIGQKNTVLNVAAPGVFNNDSDDVAFTLDTYDATSANGGTVVLNTDGSFTYTPATNYVGLDTFTYTIKDTPGLTDTATVTIDVRDPNNPVANDDGVYQTKRNQNLSIAAPGVLANDTTTIGSLSVVAGTFATAQGGSVTIASNGSFTYSPPSGYVGLDSFGYTATNGSGSDPATVVIRVLPEIYVRLQQVGGSYYALTQECSPFGYPDTGAQYDAGDAANALFRLFFYSNPAGTTPLDVTGLGLEVKIRVTGSYYTGGGYNYGYSEYPNGTTYDLYAGELYEYYRYEYNCSGTVINYRSESLTLDPGLYTII